MDLNQNPEPTMDTSDWRAQLMPDSRHRIVKKIMDTLKEHLPVCSPQGLLELRKMAQRFEEKIFTAATSQQDYLRKISLKMLTMQTKSQNTMGNNMPSDQVGPNNNMPSNPFGPSNKSPHPGVSVKLNLMDSNNWISNQNPEPTIDTSGWRVQLMPDSRLRIVNKITDTLERLHPVSGPEGLLELRKIAQKFEENIFTAATSQQDYLRKISLKMLAMETKSQNKMGNNMPSNEVGHNNNMPSNQVGPSNEPPHQGFIFFPLHPTNHEGDGGWQ